MSEYLIDLDELVLRCKDQEARKYLSEAVACYKNGAFRACIVTTWIAVVYDFVYKLRELALTGDQNASLKLKEFEEARKHKTPELALKFEKEILKWATDEFEFLSPIQKDDLNRLLTDRNRCAHPSMISDEEPYHPPAELARYHLRNAITHLLQHPPVQGKAALDRLKSDTLSEYFPTDPEKAEESFRHGPLANAKPALVRNFAISLLKTLLSEEQEGTARQRFTAALNAVRKMYPAIVADAFTQHLSKTTHKLTDSQLHNIIYFLSTVSDTWQFLSGDVHTRIENYVQNVGDEEAVEVLNLTLDMQELSSFATKRIATLNNDAFQELIKLTPRPEFVERGITIYSESGNFYIANDRASTIITPLINFMTSEDAELIIEYAAQNNQIGHSRAFTDVLEQIIDQELLTESQVEALLDKHKRSFPDELHSTFSS